MACGVGKLHWNTQAPRPVGTHKDGGTRLSKLANVLKWGWLSELYMVHIYIYIIYIYIWSWMTQFCTGLVIISFFSQAVPGYDSLLWDVPSEKPSSLRAQRGPGPFQRSAWWESSSEGLTWAFASLGRIHLKGCKMEEVDHHFASSFIAIQLE
jgi:hypothetical protein